MAVAHSAASESHTGTTGSTNQASFSWTHTQTGTPQGVVVFVSTLASVTDLITSVTYGGVELTRLTGGSALDPDGESGRVDTFFLGSGLSSNNQTITVNRTNNATVMYAAAATVTAGADTAVPTATIVLLEGDGSLAVQSVDDTSPGQNSVRYAAAYSGLISPPGAGTGSTLLNSFDIGSYGSALVRETTAGQGARNVGFSATSDDRAAVHLAIRELVPRTLTQTVGTFTLTGNNATLTKASPKVMDGGTGAFTLTGNPADTRHNPEASPVVGTFALVGNDATLGHNVKIDGGTGSFSLAGNDVTLTVAGGLNNYTLSVDAGTFAVAGGAPSLARSWALIADRGQFQLTGNAANLAVTQAAALAAAAGSFSLTGNAAGLADTEKLAVQVGTFNATGHAAAFKYFKLPADSGIFAATGNAAVLVRAISVPVAVGSYSLTGNTSTLLRGLAVAAERAPFTLTGNPAALAETQIRRRVIVFF